MKKLLFLPLCAAMVLLAGCADDNKGPKFAYLRDPDGKLDTVRADTSLCDEPQPYFNNDAELCRSTRKFILYYERPEDTISFRGYRVYLDTTPPQAPNKNWAEVRGNPQLASLLILDPSSPRGAVVFFLTDKFKDKNGPDTVLPGSKTIFALDTNGRKDPKGGFFFALLADHRRDGAPGTPLLIQLVTGDESPPNPISTAFIPHSHGLTIKWVRPSDRVSVFNPHDSGLIKRYLLEITLASSGLRISPERIHDFHPAIKYLRGGVEMQAPLADSSIIRGADTIGKVFFLPDSGRFNPKRPASIEDSLRVEFTQLHYQDTLELHLSAVDSAGNSNSIRMARVTVHLTDSTQPSKPLLSVVPGSTTRNRFAVQWTASRDSVDLDGDGLPEPAAGPNALIAEYRLTRILRRPAGEKVSATDRLDTVVAVTSSNREKAAFQDSVRFLAPGVTFQIRIQSVDISGYPSEVDSLEVSTLPIRFEGTDSASTCPPGLVPIPEDTLLLGHNGPEADPDENPSPAIPGGRRVRVASFCIEPYEHRDDRNRFVNSVTWQQADSLCTALSPQDSTRLCSEVEWERACEGFATTPLVYGLQSEGTAPGLLQSLCNVGTNDDQMAFSDSLRNKSCLTNEGVFDMPGNLTEWVRDAYDSAAYAGITGMATLPYGFSFSDPKVNPLRGTRGWNFLQNPRFSTAQTDRLARCSNRDFAQQIRPVYRADCLDSLRPRIAVIYGEGIKGFLCMEIPEPLRNVKITGLVPAARDSTKFLVFREGTDVPDSLSIPADPAFKGKKPVDIRLTPLSLAIATFRNSVSGREIVDTLDNLEMRDTSQAALSRIFQRESGDKEWRAVQENGRYRLRFLYGQTVLGSKPAKEYYSSITTGFRCCSLPRAAPAGAAPQARR